MDELNARTHEDPPTGYDQEFNQVFFGAMKSAHDRLVNDRRDYSKWQDFLLPGLYFLEKWKERKKTSFIAFLSTHFVLAYIS